MGIGCPHCRVIGGPHDDGCPWHPSADAAREECEEEMGELRRTIETNETRILELESDLEKADRRLEVGKDITRALISKLDKMETHDMELERARDWAGGPWQEVEDDGN